MFTQAFEILWTYRQGFISGLKVTMELALFIWVVGILLGTFTGLLANIFPLTAGRCIRSAAAVLSAIPAIVLLFWAYFPLQIIVGVTVEPFWTSALTLTTLNCVAVAELVRGLLAEFPPQYRDAATVCGLSPAKTFFRIELPLILRQALPTLLMLQVTMLHLTLFTSLISVEDVFRIAQRINSTVYRPVEIYSAVAILFLIICLPLQLLARHLQRHFGITLRER